MLYTNEVTEGHIMFLALSDWLGIVGFSFLQISVETLHHYQKIDAHDCEHIEQINNYNYNDFQIDKVPIIRYSNPTYYLQCFTGFN
jgi:hypothetical protein